MIDLTDCQNLKAESAIQCPICLEIPRYPLIFLYGHLECHNCYSTDFALRARRCELKFFSTCPICRSDVIPEKVSTAEVEFKLRPSSKVSIFYKSSRAMPQPWMQSVYSIPASNSTRNIQMS